ncbi:terminase small subunit [Polluticoccus soli]|uniref:terminase small subunit n=1 Tax=Polluticoccus soli TaxID=3034150 RepID=UPI0023E2910C|nr:terminase small subunit [Flavipsychrobacter sp. JY13-12]
MNMNQHSFVCELLRHGNKCEAYKTAYRPQNENPRSIESAANRLMKNPEVSAAITEAQERMLEEARQELKEKYVAELLTVQRKRELLAQIAEGKWMEQPPPDHIEGQRVPVMVPTLKERLKAIDMDNRMDGSYRATAQNQATETGELPRAQNETELIPPAREKDKTQQNTTKQPVKVPAAIYVPVTNNKIEKPAIEPQVVPPAPYLNTPRFPAENNKTQQTRGLRTVRQI